MSDKDAVHLSELLDGHAVNEYGWCFCGRWSQTSDSSHGEHVAELILAQFDLT